MKFVCTSSIESDGHNINLLYWNCSKMALKQDSVHFILYPKRGMNKIEGVVLNRGCIKKNYHRSSWKSEIISVRLEM